jgi:hypothetical protein
MVGHEGIFLDEDVYVERSPTANGGIHCYKEIITQEDSDSVNPIFLCKMKDDACRNPQPSTSGLFNFLICRWSHSSLKE